MFQETELTGSYYRLITLSPSKQYSMLGQSFLRKHTERTDKRNILKCIAVPFKPVAEALKMQSQICRLLSAEQSQGKIVWVGGRCNVGELCHYLGLTIFPP